MRKGYATNLCHGINKQIKSKSKDWKFPGSPVVRTLHSYCLGCRFDPFWGTKILQAAQHGHINKEILALGFFELFFEA